MKDCRIIFKVDAKDFLNIKKRVKNNYRINISFLTKKRKPHKWGFLNRLIKSNIYT